MTDAPDPYVPPTLRGVPPHVPPGRADLGGLALIVVYGFFWLFALVGVALVTLALLAIPSVASGHPEEAFEAMLQGGAAASAGALPTWVLAGTLLVQFPLMFAMAPLTHVVVGWLWYRRRAPEAARPGGWRRIFGIASAPLGFYGLAVAMGLTVGVLPGWIAEQLRELLPSLGEGMIEQIDAALRSGGPVARTAFVLEITVLAPVVEELVFRGFMWDALRRFLPLPLVWVGTSLLFALYHMDPVQSLALIWTALGLGWVRWMSGSVWPGVLLHAVNNSLGVAAALWLGGETGGGEASLPLALGTAAFATALAAGTTWLRARRGGAFRTDAPLA